MTQTVDADIEAVHRLLTHYATRRRRLASRRPTPWLDTRIDELLDELLELRRAR